MIQSVLLREGDRLTEYSARGHSGYAEAGSDIVCAAVSILSCTCVNSLESVCGVKPVLHENREGSIRFRLPKISEAQDRDCQILMRSLAQGLSDLQEAYPKYIHFSIQERRKST